MSFFDRVDRDLVIQEATYGFVMALTFVTATQLGFLDMSETALVIAIVAMDFVWGAIDLFIFFNIDVLSQRRRRFDLIRIYSGNPEDHRDEIYDMLQGTVFDDIDEDSKLKAVDVIVGARLQSQRETIKDTRVYLFNAVTAFIVTVLTAVPSAVCILLIDDMWVACLAAAASSCVALFFTGYFMAVSDNRTMRIIFGLILMVTTMGLTLFAAYFGG